MKKKGFFVLTLQTVTDYSILHYGSFPYSLHCRRHSLVFNNSRELN